MDMTPNKCNVALDDPTPENQGGKLPVCSCQDCRDVCVAPPQVPPSPEPPNVNGLPLHMFLLILAFAIIALVLVAEFCYRLVILFLKKKGPSDAAQSQTATSNSHLANENSTIGARSDQDQAKISQTGGFCASIVAAWNTVHGAWETAGVWIEVHLHYILRKWGTFCSRHAVLIIIIPLIIAALPLVGFAFLRVTTNPVELWSSPESDVRQQRNYYEHTFKPFHRIAMVIIKMKNGPQYYEHHPSSPFEDAQNISSLLELHFLEEVLTLQEAIVNITAHEPSLNRTVRLSDICFKPLSPDYDICMIQTPLGYFQNNRSKLLAKGYDPIIGEIPLADHVSHLKSCVNSPASISDSTALNMPCLSDFGGPVFPFTSFGGFPQEKLPSNNIIVRQYLNATSLILTFAITNDADRDSDQILMARAWELAFIKFMLQYEHENMTLVFNSERSIEDEIDRQSEADILTVAVSYFSTFVYVTLTLGTIRKFSTIFVDLKLSLGLASVFIVLLSVFSSFGVNGLIGLPMTLIIAEVVPFLTISVGIDSIFIMVQGYERTIRQPGETLEEQIGRAVGYVAPSMLVSGIPEIAAFFLGALTPMPAVQMFAYYSGWALLIDLFLQLTCFIGLLTLDARRKEAYRLECLCCVRSCVGTPPERAPEEFEELPAALAEAKESRKTKVSSSQVAPMAVTNGHIAIVDADPVPNGMPNGKPKFDQEGPRVYDPENIRYEERVHERIVSPMVEEGGPIYYLIKRFYAPFLMHDVIRPLIMIIFAGWMCTCFILIPYISIGLDQMLAMPEDSYVLRYFKAQREDMAVGPPGFMVIEDGHDYTTKVGQELVCASAGCPENSLLGQLFTASQNSKETRVASPASSWLDDYIDWLAPQGNPRCCRVINVTEEFCPATNSSPSCVNCKVGREQGRPIPDDFIKFLPYFLQDNPGTKCAKGGHAAYGTAVKLLDGPNGKKRVGATYFMFYHSVLRYSPDFIGAYRSALELAQNITQTIRNAIPGSSYKVFPYSIFYVFYEQYLEIVPRAAFNLSICVLVIAVLSTILLGLQIVSAIWIAANCSFIVISLLGMCQILDIELNALSLVNLVVALGISVEFGAHLIRDFAVRANSPKMKTRKERAHAALVNMGSSVFTGCALTNVPGTVILAFSFSQLFRTYFFQIYMGIIIFGVFHGLIVLPVLLSYIGPGTSLERQKKLLAEELRLKLLLIRREAIESEEPRSNGTTGRTDLQGVTQPNGHVPLSNSTTTPNSTQSNPVPNISTVNEEATTRF